MRLGAINLVNIYKSFQYSHDESYGELTISNRDILNDILIALEDSNLSGIYYDGIVDFQIGQTIELQIDRPKRKILTVVQNFNSLVSAYPLRQPRNYYLIEEKFYNQSDKAIQLLSQYEQIIQFCKFLICSATVFDEKQGILTFLDGNKKCEININYSAEDLFFLKNNKNISEAISKLISNYSNSDNTHYEQFLSMLSIIIVERYSQSTESKDRFIQLIHDAEIILSEIEHSHRLYCANFSYKKFKEELQSAQLEIVAKIHKTFSDIQNQILGIPVATIIVASQMKVTSKVDHNFYIDFAVLLGCLIYATLTWLAINNQQNTLNVLGKEIQHREKIARDELKIVDTELDNLFFIANERYKWQKSILKIIRWVVVLAGIASIIVFLFCTYEAFSNLFSNFFMNIG